MRYDPDTFSEGDILRFSFLSSDSGDDPEIVLAETVPADKCILTRWRCPNCTHFRSKEELLLYLETLGLRHIDFYGDTPDMREFLMTGRIVRPGSYVEIEKDDLG